MERDYAIVVGISQYPHLTSLLGPERDADDFYVWLKATDGGDVPAPNITRIVSSAFKDDPAYENGTPTAELIETAFWNLVSKGRKEGGRLGRRLYIYFSGHGISPERSYDDAALLTANARSGLGYHIMGGMYANAIKMEGFFEEVLLFMDCCRDAQLTLSIRPPPWTWSDTQRGSLARSCYAYATRYGLKAREKPFLGDQLVDPGTPGAEWRGVFTVALLEALKGHKVNAAGEVTTETVREHVENRLLHLLTDDEYVPPKFVAPDPITIVAPKNGPRTSPTVEVEFAIVAAHPVDLVGPSALVIETFVSGARAVRQLPPGLYLLREQVTNRQAGIPVLGGGRINVDF